MRKLNETVAGVLFVLCRQKKPTSVTLCLCRRHKQGRVLKLSCWYIVVNADAHRRTQTHTGRGQIFKKTNLTLESFKLFGTHMQSTPERTVKVQ